MYKLKRTSNIAGNAQKHVISKGSKNLIIYGAGPLVNAILDLGRTPIILPQGRRNAPTPEKNSPISRNS